MNDDLVEPDEELQRFIDLFKEVVNRKYNTILCRLARKLTHPNRQEETELGNLIADILIEGRLNPLENKTILEIRSINHVQYK